MSNRESNSRYDDFYDAMQASNVSIYFGDTESMDAFGRLRVSNPTTLFDSKQIHDKLPLFWDEAVGGGAVSGVYTAADAATTMTVSGSGEYVIRQTKMRMNYQPGKSILVLMTFVLGDVVANTTKRIGYFNSNTSAPYTGNIDGVYLEQDGTTQNIVQSKNGVATAIPQASWNVDTMDGNGASGITIDWTKTQILFIDFEWLGVGRVRFGFVIDGIFYTVHEFQNANSLGSVYMSSPNHSCRYEIRSGGGTSSIDHICSTVVSEGGEDPLGVLHYASTAGTHINADTENSIYAIVGIRLKSTHLDSTVKLLNASLQLQTASETAEWLILLNPSVSGELSYQDVDNSCCQYAVGSGNIVTDGTYIMGGFIHSASTGQGNGTTDVELNNALKMGAGIDGTRDTMVLCVRPNGGSINIDVEGGVSWRELV